MSNRHHPGDDVLDEARKFFHYDPETGVFYWKQDRRGFARSGAAAGYLTKRGYVHLVLNGRRHYAHRLAWLMQTGKWPEHQIDHINRNRSDNRWRNLRQADCRLNNQNSICTKNSTGYPGAYFSRGTFHAHIKVNGKVRYLGKFSNPKDASEAYLSEKERVHQFKRAGTNE